MERLRTILQSRWTGRIIISVYVVALAIAVAVYMAISWDRVRTAAYVHGSSTLEKEASNPVRGALHNLDREKNRRRARVKFLLHEGDGGGASERKRWTLAGFDLRGNGVFETSLDIPDGVPTGTHELVLRARGESFQAFRATREVEVREGGDPEVEWPEKTVRIENDKLESYYASGPIESQEGEIAIDVIPTDGQLARGLPGRVFLRTYDEESGRPVPSRVEFESVEGAGQWGTGRSNVPDSVETGLLGLAELSLSPMGGQRWELRAEALDSEEVGDDAEESPVETGRATIRVYTVPTQISLEISRPLIGERRDVRGEISCVFRTGEILHDLYRGDRWLQAGALELSGRASTLRIRVPERGGSAWLHRLQLTRGFYDIVSNWESRYVVDPNALDDSTPSGAIRRTLAFVAEHRDDTYFEHLDERESLPWKRAGAGTEMRWLRAFLRAIPRHLERPEQLYDTEEPHKEELDAWRERVLGDLMIVIGLGLAGGLAVLLYVVLVGIRRNREHGRELRAVDAEYAAEEAGAAGAAEGDSEEDERFLSPEQSATIQVVLLGTVAVFTFAMFAMGVLFLLSNM